MPEPASSPRIRWERLPLARELPLARDWLQRELASGLSAVSIDAYSRAVERYLAYCRERRIAPHAATAEYLAAYFEELAGAGLGRAARGQRLIAIRLFYAFVVERGLRPDNPAASFPGIPLLSRAGTATDVAESLPWAPAEEEWRRVLAAARAERPRSRLMLALAYDAALRREELCALRIADVDPREGIVRVSTVGGVSSERTRERVVRCSPAVAERLAEQLVAVDRQRDDDLGGAGALFRSESPRNRAQPVSIWTWSKVTRAVARRSGVERFTSHTPRCLRLVDLARAGLSAADIAHFAGLRRAALALRYLQLAREVLGPGGDEVASLRGEQFARLLSRVDD